MRGDFLSCLNMIYGKPASVTVIKGDWKTGKTNFGLYLAQVLKKCNLVQQMGGNIECFKDLKTRERDPKFEFIDNFLRLEMWGYTPFRKVYIFDEAIKKWQEYAKITGAANWYKITDDLIDLIKKVELMTISNSNQYYELWLQLRNNIKHNNIGHYVYNIMEKLYAKDFLNSKSTLSFDLATGIFCFIENRIV